MVHLFWQRRTKNKLHHISLLGGTSKWYPAQLDFTINISVMLLSKLLGGLLIRQSFKSVYATNLLECNKMGLTLWEFLFGMQYQGSARHTYTSRTNCIFNCMCATSFITFTSVLESYYGYGLGLHDTFRFVYL